MAYEYGPLADFATGILPPGTIVKINGIPFRIAYHALVDSHENNFELAGIKRWPPKEELPKGDSDG